MHKNNLPSISKIALKLLFFFSTISVQRTGFLLVILKSCDSITIHSVLCLSYTLSSITIKRHILKTECNMAFK
jgi:hypothetical protein